MLSYAIAAAGLYWVFHDLDLRELFHSYAATNWWWIPSAIALDVLSYVIAAWEWQILLRPVGRVLVRQTMQAIFAGRFANDLLPVHAGYVIRVYLVSRWTRASAVVVTPSLLVERLFDGFWLALGIGLTAVFFPLPPRIGGIAKFWAAIILFGLIVGAAIVFCRPAPALDSSASKRGGRILRELRHATHHVLEQVRAIGRSWIVIAGFGLSFLKFAAQCFAFLALLRAYHFHFPLAGQMAIFLIAYAGLSVPSTPGSVGVFQVFCVTGLELFHVEKAVAAGFALMAFIVLTAPLAVAGFFAFAHTGLTLRQMRSRAGQWKAPKNDDDKLPLGET